MSTVNSWQDGHIRVDKGETIACPGMVFDALHSLNVPKKDWVVENSPEWRRVAIGPVIIQGYESHVTEYFRNNRLDRLSIVVSEKFASKQFGSDNRELKEFDFYRTWVGRNGAQTSDGKFPWGTIVAVKDHWTLMPSIEIRYGRD